MPTAGDASGATRPRELTVEYETDPAAVDPTRAPRLSWRIETDRRGAGQTAYRVLVAHERDALDADGAGEPAGTFWDSGRVESARAVAVLEGPALASDETYHWTVMCWTDAGETAWAEPASFSTGLAPEDWRGEWITHQPGPGDSNGWRSRWHPADRDGETWVQVDLGESRELSAVELHPAEPVDLVRTPDGTVVTLSWDDDPIAELGFPEAYRIEVADDPAFEDPAVVARGPGDAALQPAGESSGAAGGVDDGGDGGAVVDVGNGGGAVVDVGNGGGAVADDGAGGADGDDSLTGPVRTRLHDDVSVRGRYVRVTATDLDVVEPAAARSSRAGNEGRRVERAEPWQCFALAGLVVRDAEGSDLAVARPVSASSSVETDTWGREHLVNGHERCRVGTTSPQLRTAFDLERPVASARLHVAAVGYGEVHVNGERLGDGRLDPAWTDYEQRVLTRTFDVTDHLGTGANALGLWLGRGWFAKRGAHWAADGSPRARATLAIEFEDGTTRTLSTDGDWCARPSPVVANDLYDGERYDARLERAGWARPGDVDQAANDPPTASDSGGDPGAGWESAAEVAPPGGTLRPQRIEPMRVVDEFAVESVRDHPDGPILDFGQNLTGWLRVELDEPPAGAELTLRHAEALDEDGGLSTVDLRTADATDAYVAAGDGREHYEPRFTYHGFRYAQLVGDPEALASVEPEQVTARVVHTAMDRRGEFACSNGDLERVQHNAVWGLRGNTHAIPEDCPQRDERFGWTGDAQICARALLFNFDAVRFHEKWMRDHDDAASPMGYVPDVIPDKAPGDPADPTWSITRVVVPWYCYRHDGDERVLRDHYEGMREYVDYWLSTTDEDGIVPAKYGKYGDWLAFENADGRRGLPYDLFATAFLYQVTDTFARIATVLGNDADAARYRDRAAAISAGFQERFWDPEREEYGPGTQSSFAVPLFLGLVPEGRRETVVSGLAAKVRSDDGKLRTGFLGTRPLLHVLADHGRADLAYRVVAQPERPGWVYMARNGATTMWERWDSDERVGDGMNSLNHSPFTHVSEFFYECLAGVRIGDRPATDHVTVAPALVEALDWVEASVETRNGALAVDWERSGPAATAAYDLSVTVPWNGSATVRLPDAAGATVTESGVDLDAASLEGVRSVTTDGDHVVVEVGAGRYEFAVR